MKFRIIKVTKVCAMYSPKMTIIGERSRAKPPRLKGGIRLRTGIMIGFTTAPTAS
jgi:hypothetical protein